MHNLLGVRRGGQGEQMAAPQMEDSAWGHEILAAGRIRQSRVPTISTPAGNVHNIDENPAMGNQLR